jgi:transposase-like protein
MFVPDSFARMQSLLDAGVSLAEVARRTGVPYSVVRQHRDGGETTATSAFDDEPNATVASTQPTTGDEVCGLLAAGLSRAEIARRLDISKGTVTYHARRLGLPVDHRAARRYDWSAVQTYYDDGHTVLDCCTRFGFSSSTWSSAVRRGDAVARPTAMPIEELLRRSRNRTNLKARLVEAGLLSLACRDCGVAEWRGRTLALELHHINGDGSDNRLENLTLLCPNCHSQTDSWGGRNTQRAGSATEPRAARSARSTR